MGRRRERLARRKQVYPFLLPPLRQRFNAPRPLESEPERAAYAASRRAGTSGAHSSHNPGLSLAESAAYGRGVWAGRGEDDPRAPVAWPLELVFLGLQAAAAESEPEPDPHDRLATFLYGAPAMLTAWVLERARGDLERHRALQLGLTPETTPQISPTSWVYALAAMLVQRGYLFATRRRLRQPQWPRVLATGVIRELDRRRAWNKAHAAAREAAAGG
jgi:hypothetical protein